MRARSRSPRPPLGQWAATPARRTTGGSRGWSAPARPRLIPSTPPPGPRRRRSLAAAPLRNRRQRTAAPCTPPPSRWTAPLRHGPCRAEAGHAVTRHGRSQPGARACQQLCDPRPSAASAGRQRRAAAGGAPRGPRQGTLPRAPVPASAWTTTTMARSSPTGCSQLQCSSIVCACSSPNASRPWAAGAAWRGCSGAGWSARCARLSMPPAPP